jgi:hypothetical protein
MVVYPYLKSGTVSYANNMSFFSNSIAQTFKYHTRSRKSSLPLLKSMNSLCHVASLVLVVSEVNSGSVVSIDEDLLESEAEKIVGGLLDVLPVLSDKLAGRLGEDKIDLLQSLVLGLRHEEELVEPSVERVQLA